MDKKKPIITESGVFFKNHYEAQNPSADLLADILNNRKVSKNLMFDAKKAGDLALEKFYDLRQKGFKLFANSWFGVSGQAASFIYNLYVALSITGKGQAIISTSTQAFEQFLAGNIIFTNVDECLEYIRRIVKENKQLPKKLKLEPISVDDCHELLMSKFSDHDEKEMHSKTVKQVLEHLSSNTITCIYYRNNLLEFINDSSLMKTLLVKTILVGQKENFINVEEIPNGTKPYLEQAWEYLFEHVYHPYGTHNRITHLKTSPRYAVPIIDTDSNFLNLGPIVHNSVRNIIDLTGKGEYKKIINKYDFTIITVFTYFIWKLISDIFWRFTEQGNVPEEFRKIIAMKSEFFMPRVVISDGKKNYTSIVKKQEGVDVAYHKQIDIKGLSFKKSNVNKTVRESFMSILEDNILRSETIETSNIISRLIDLREQIRSSLADGKTEFMYPTSANAPDTYANPFGMMQVRAMMIHNAIYPDTPIMPADKFNMIKLTADSIEGIRYLYDENPEVYDIIKETVFDTPEMEKHGFTIIGFPKSTKKLPDWLIPIIDYDTIIEDNLKKFTPVVEAVSIKTIGNKADDAFISNIIDF